jgi:hypothetical protein
LIHWLEICEQFIDLLDTFKGDRFTVNQNTISLLLSSLF